MSALSKKISKTFSFIGQCFTFLLVPYSGVFADTMTVGSNSGSDSLSFNGNTATVSVPDVNAQYRSYTLSTTENLRDNIPATNSLTINEGNSDIIIRSGDLLFDALFSLALHENDENSVSEISDNAYNEGNPIQAPPGGYFETGRKWTYVWTRDTAYAVDLGLALIDPIRSRNSLAFKLSDRRDVSGAPEIIQDTGTGGSWPLSTDRVIWAIGAREVLRQLTGSARIHFRDTAYTAMVNTIASDRLVVFDPNDGLYTGEQSFLDWREQSYASWTAKDTVHIGMSKSLSTNVAHFIILELAADLASEKELTHEATQYQAWANNLKTAINANFWLADKGLYAGLIGSPLDSSAIEKYDLLGLSLAIISGVADQAKAEQIMANYPHSEVGPPVIWPQQPFTPIYHNRGIWPFVTAYSLRAAKVAHNDSVITHNVMSLINGSAINLSNMENFEFISLGNYVEDGEYSGPVINSQRQLWSVAAYISMTLDIIFGMETDESGIRFLPFITKDLRTNLFSNSSRLALSNLNYKGKTISVLINLPDTDGLTDGYYDIQSIQLNGSTISTDFVSESALQSSNVFEITLTQGPTRSKPMTIVKDTGDWREFFAPREPSITSVIASSGLLTVNFTANGETSVVFNIYRNGTKVASGINTTSWTDPNSSNYHNEVYLYSVEAEFTRSGHVSHHSRAQGFWPANTVESITFGDARLVSLDRASSELNHGRWHFNNWGKPHEVLEVQNFNPIRSGNYSLQVIYANAMGPVNTGVTASVKRIEIFNSENVKIHEDVVYMPHLPDWQTWSESSLINEVFLNDSEIYQIRISDYRNMSYFEHNRLYNLAPGQSETPINNRANIEGIKLLFLNNIPNTNGF
ncbi:hypothetical protein [Zooshikella ganghwensis]|uniref:Alpha-L-rhamnosidase six-hairpin glycosidase domain-containing protein n=1 Tax=Zooshikella ganghwensis TaxID=202772 RepID=A0A4V1ING6_9GAMM|nr:hypothetical protein [Zooshikella ganghwensis]RDH43661.1 hypothetical protein B9G39_09540 [Zooshikella ganghwensis]